MTFNTDFNKDVLFTQEEQNFMEKAFDFAKEALAKQEVPVGCIFVYKEEIIAVGSNTVNETKNPTRHAEINCIEQVFAFSTKNNIDLHSLFSEISVYVTVEPCIMCAAALFDLKVRSIVYGCKNDRFGGSTVFNIAGVLKPVTVVKAGFKANEAMGLLKEFYKGTNPSAPVSKVKTKKSSKS